MIILGLTGSIAMGKSTAAAMFRRLGVPVFDADHSVHRHLADDRQAIAKIAAVFPGVVREGRIDRAALAAAVFGDDAALDCLERILHPLVDADQERFLKIAARHGAALVVLDIPLLFETGRERHCDRVAVVSAPWFVQLQRLKARPGMDRTRLETTLARQMPDAEKRRRADYIIPTGRSRGETMRTISRIVAELRTRPAAPCRRRRKANAYRPRRDDA
jgi:dephospho-CoA kinase